MVGIVDHESGGTCTGSLIAPNLMLSAQQCVADVISPGCADGTFGPPRPASAFYLTTKPTLSFDPADYHDVAEILVPQGSGFCVTFRPTPS